MALSIDMFNTSAVSAPISFRIHPRWPARAIVRATIAFGERPFNSHLARNKCDSSEKKAARTNTGKQAIHNPNKMANNHILLYCTVHHNWNCFTVLLYSLRLLCAWLGVRFKLIGVYNSIFRLNCITARSSPTENVVWLRQFYGCSELNTIFRLKNSLSGKAETGKSGSETAQTRASITSGSEIHSKWFIPHELCVFVCFVSEWIAFQFLHTHDDRL